MKKFDKKKVTKNSLILLSVFCKKITLTIIISLCLSMVWQLLELIIYKEVQPRAVDDIMMLVYMPFVYMAIR